MGELNKLIEIEKQIKKYLTLSEKILNESKNLISLNKILNELLTWVTVLEKTGNHNSNLMLELDALNDMLLVFNKLDDAQKTILIEKISKSLSRSIFLLQNG